jgi:hypothetical protein
MNNGTTPKGAPVQPAKENVAGTGTKKIAKKTAKQRAEEQLKRSGIDTNGMTFKEMRSTIQRLKAEGKLVDARAGNGALTTEESLQARGLDILLEKHIGETVSIRITDGKGNIVYVEKPRVVVALEKLFERGTKGAGETQALEKWLDRVMGKPAQALAVKHSGEIGTYTAKKPSKAALAAKKAYAANIEE